RICGGGNAGRGGEAPESCSKQNRDPAPRGIGYGDVLVTIMIQVKDCDRRRSRPDDVADGRNEATCSIAHENSHAVPTLIDDREIWHAILVEVSERHVTN